MTNQDTITQLTDLATDLMHKLEMACFAVEDPQEAQKLQSQADEAHDLLMTILHS